MKVFVAGGSGVLGVRVVPLLVAAGHAVAAMTRSPGKAEILQSTGAAPVVCDVFDLDALRREVVAFGSDAIIHLVTDLPDDPSHIHEHAAANSRVRREGTRNLLSVAAAAQVEHFVAQSVAWEIPGEGGAAVADLEEAVLAYGGVVVRCGQFYGHGTYHPARPPPGPRIHIDEAARQTVAALHEQAGLRWAIERER